LGILRLSKKFGASRLEQASTKAFSINSPGYHTVKTMLARNMEGVPIAESHNTNATTTTPTLGAANVRGRNYYH